MVESENSTKKNDMFLNLRKSKSSNIACSYWYILTVNIQKKNLVGCSHLWGKVVTVGNIDTITAHRKL